MEVIAVATVFDLLEREWAGLAGDRASARHLVQVCEAAGGAADLAGVEAYVRDAAPPDADAVLLVLVARAVDGDVLAARVLLQLLLPGTRRLARRWWALGDEDERAAAAVGAVYQRIRTYPLARRPGRVAANVLMDANQILARSVSRVRTVPHPDPAVVAAPSGAGPSPNPAVELAGVLDDAVAGGVISPAEAELIARSRIAGDRVEDLARQAGLRPRTLWDRRQRAERVLAGTRP